MGAQPFQDFHARHARHAHVQNEQLGKRVFRPVRVGAAALEVSNDLLAICDFAHDFKMRGVVRNCPLQEKAV